jgi:hypothetical protein
VGFTNWKDEGSPTNFLEMHFLLGEGGTKITSMFRLGFSVKKMQLNTLAMGIGASALL